MQQTLWDLNFHFKAALGFRCLPKASHLARKWVTSTERVRTHNTGCPQISSPLCCHYICDHANSLKSHGTFPFLYIWKTLLCTKNCIELPCTCTANVYPTAQHVEKASQLTKVFSSFVIWSILISQLEKKLQEPLCINLNIFNNILCAHNIPTIINPISIFFLFLAFTW